MHASSCYPVSEWYCNHEAVHPFDTGCQVFIDCFVSRVPSEIFSPTVCRQTCAISPPRIDAGDNHCTRHAVSFTNGLHIWSLFQLCQCCNRQKGRPLPNLNALNICQIDKINTKNYIHTYILMQV